MNDNIIGEDILGEEDILLDERPYGPDCIDCQYTYQYEVEECVILTFGPGVVKYLRGCYIRRYNYKRLLNEIEKLGSPLITFPHKLPLIRTKGPDDSWYNDKNVRINLHYFNVLIAETDFKKQFGILTFIAEEYRASPFSEEAYWAFSEYLGLKKLAIKEFRESQLEVWGIEMINSYLGSENHEVLNGDVYIKTQFWINSRRNIEKSIEQEKRREILQMLEASQMQTEQELLESGYKIYVYVMEDTRNGLFKIGRSNNPLKRERTLQSEVPTTQMRIALPCPESMEAELHQRYAAFRKRGEWFSIDSSLLFEVVTELLVKGDATRLIGEREWLAEILIRRFGKI